MFRDQYNARVLNCDLVEGFETVDRSKQFAILLEDEEPS
jgi:hypothetical protein